MAYGLPDYYRGVDITYQTIGQVINRPKYGGAESAWGSRPVDANDITTLLSISSKGMLYGGVVYMAYGFTQAKGLFELKVDGSFITDKSLVSLNAFGIKKPQSYPIYLLKFDDTKFVYSVAVSYGITFENEVVLSYVEDDGGTPTIYFDINYALI